MGMHTLALMSTLWLVGLVLPLNTHRAGEGNQVVWYSETLEVPPNQTLTGNVLVMGGQVTVHPGAWVRGSVYVFRGQVELAGTIEGDVVVMGGQVVLRPSARVLGALRHLEGDLERSPQAQVAREVRPPGLEGATWGTEASRLLDRLWRLLWSLIRGLALGLVAMVLALRWPQALEAMERPLHRHPWRALTVGLVTTLLLVVLGLLLAFTVLGLPLALVVALVYYGLQYLARIVLALPVARYAAEQWLKPWPYPVWLALATVGVNVGLELLLVIPCIGWALHWALLAAGMGAVLLSRLGRVPYPEGPSPAASSG